MQRRYVQNINAIGKRFGEHYWKVCIGNIIIVYSRRLIVCNRNLAALKKVDYKRMQKVVVAV